MTDDDAVIEEAQKPAPQLSVEDLERRLAGLEADLAAARQAEKAAGERASEALALGNDADEAIAARAQAKAKSESITEAIDYLRPLIAELKRAKGQTRARERAVALRRGYGSRLTLFKQDVARVIETGVALEVALARLDERYAALVDGWLEALALHERFGVDAEIERPPVAPDRDEAVQDALRQLRSLHPQRTMAPPVRLNDLPHRSAGAGWDLRRVLKRIEGTPTAGLLDELGAGPIGDPEQWEQMRRSAEARARADRTQREQEQRDRVDGWLRDRLQAGPQPKDVVYADAAKMGILMKAIGPVRADLVNARRRLNVVPLTRLSDGVAHLALADADFDTKVFSDAPSGLGLGRLGVGA